LEILIQFWKILDRPHSAFVTARRIFRSLEQVERKDVLTRRLVRLVIRLRAETLRAADNTHPIAAETSRSGLVEGGVMKASFWGGIIASVAALSVVSGVAHAQVSDNDGCSNATLRGDYAFSTRGVLLGFLISGVPQYFSSPVPLDAVAMSNADGRGKLTAVGFNVVNGVVPPRPTDSETGFGIDQSGSYTVFPDCTGDFELSLPGPISISAKFVLAKDGREIHALIYQEHVPSPVLGCISPSGCDVLPQYHSDGTKLLSSAQDSN
jgi:hypothetical protein